MNKLNPQNQLFLKLEKNKPKWWNNLISNKDIYIDIRKDNYIDIYYNGGNIIQGLKYKNGKFTGSIHYKYLLPEKSEYINFDFSESIVGLKKNGIDLSLVDDFEPKSLKRIKANISTYYPVSSEKGIQAKLATTGQCFLDTEFQYNHKVDNGLRVDLVWIDNSNKKIVFIELKTMGDSRLFTDEIYNQLKKYNEFVDANEEKLLKYYFKVFEIKKKLQILPKGLTILESLDGYSIETKPLLVVGDSKQEWINAKAEGINERIKDIAIGAYYFGSSVNRNCDILQKTRGNKYIF